MGLYSIPVPCNGRALLNVSMLTNNTMASYSCRFQLQWVVHSFRPYLSAQIPELHTTHKRFQILTTLDEPSENVQGHDSVVVNTSDMSDFSMSESDGSEGQLHLGITTDHSVTQPSHSHSKQLTTTDDLESIIISSNISPDNSPTPSPIHSLTPSTIHSPAQSPTVSTHPIIDSFSNAVTDPFSHPITNPFTHLVTNPFTFKFKWWW